MTNAALLHKTPILQTVEYLLNEKSFTGSPDSQLIFILVHNLEKKREKLNVTHTHIHTHSHTTHTCTHMHAHTHISEGGL